MGVQRHAPAALPPGKRPGTHCTGGCVGLGAGLNLYGKSRPPPPPAFKPRTVQPVVSRYTLWVRVYSTLLRAFSVTFSILVSDQVTARTQCHATQINLWSDAVLGSQRYLFAYLKRPGNKFSSGCPTSFHNRGLPEHWCVSSQGVP